MTDENKEVLASESHEETTTTTDTQVEVESTDVDYEAELANIQAQKEKLEGKLKKAGEKIDNLKQAPSLDEETISRLVEEKIGSVTAQIKATALDTMIKQHSTNDKEAELIKYHLENTIRPTGNDYDDLKNAKALANRSKFDQQVSEIKRASQETEAQPQTTAGQKQEVKKEISLSKEESKMAKVFGLSPEEIKNGYQR